MEKKYKPLREVRVTYSSGDVIETNMSSNLYNKEIKDYFKVGKTFNIGSLNDRLAKVKNVKILR